MALVSSGVEGALAIVGAVCIERMSTVWTVLVVCEVIVEGTAVVMMEACSVT